MTRSLQTLALPASDGALEGGIVMKGGLEKIQPDDWPAFARESGYGVKKRASRSHVLARAGLSLKKLRNNDSNGASHSGKSGSSTKSRENAKHNELRIQLLVQH